MSVCDPLSIHTDQVLCDPHRCFMKCNFVVVLHTKLDSRKLQRGSQNTQSALNPIFTMPRSPGDCPPLCHTIALHCNGINAALAAAKSNLSFSLMDTMRVKRWNETQTKKSMMTVFEGSHQELQRDVGRKILRRASLLLKVHRP